MRVVRCFQLIYQLKKRRALSLSLSVLLFVLQSTKESTEFPLERLGASKYEMKKVSLHHNIEMSRINGSHLL